MNILFLATFGIDPSAGGVQRVTDTLAKELIKRGNSVIFLSVCARRFFHNCKSSIPQFHIDVDSSSDWKNQLHKLINNNHIEYVINQMPGNKTNQIVSELPRGVKVVTVFHTQPFLNDNLARRQILRSRTYNVKQFFLKYLSFCFPLIRMLIFGRYEKQNIKNALDVSDRVCFISERFFPRILRHIPDFPKEKLVAINNPNTFENSVEIKEKENIILWIGRIENGIKNTIDFVKVWEKLYNICPRWKAIVAGDGEDLPHIKKYVKKRRIKNIDIIGHCDDVESLYRKAKIIVVTSFSESWGMVLTEGMTYGCIPCAYNTYESARDIILDDAGLLSNPNPIDMSMCIQRLMQNENLCKKMSNKAIVSVKRFSVGVIANQWVDLLRSIE